MQARGADRPGLVRCGSFCRHHKHQQKHKQNCLRNYPERDKEFKDIIRNYNAQCAPDDQLPDISLHGLRHTAASVLINQHTDIETVSKRLGHSWTSVTLDIYTHAIQEADKAAASLLDSIAKSAGI